MHSRSSGGRVAPRATARNSVILDRAAHERVSFGMVDGAFDDGWPYSDNDGIQAVIERWHLMQLQAHQND